MQIYQPKVIFEIGTFQGRSTLAMAQNSRPDTKLFTLDLPAAAIDTAALAIAAGDEKYIQKDVSGAFFQGTEVAHKITQLYGDSATFDFSAFEKKVDFIFIDGAHSYDYVISDTLVALRLISETGGLIIWHDYDTIYWEGVTRALNQFYRDQNLPAMAELTHLLPTTIACLQIAVRRKV